MLINNPIQTDIKSDLSNIYVVLPSFEPDAKLPATIYSLINCGFSHIVLIDDGSNTEYSHFFHDIVSVHKDKIILLRHNQNMGKGAALKTGFQWILSNRPNAMGVVTIDGDGQLLAEDALKCSLHMLQTDCIILGCRDFSDYKVPFRNKLGNKFTAFVFNTLCKIPLSDTQTGLRAIPMKYLSTISKISGNRFEYETNMLLTIKDMNLNFDEVSISTIYNNDNSTHYDTMKDSIRIYKIILSHLLHRKHKQKPKG